MAKQEIAVSSPVVLRGIDRVLSVQRPIVLAHIRSIRRGHPNASPDEMIRILERRYLTAVTTGGALVGASSAIPAIGTATTLALSGIETAGFLEASALFAQSVTEVHGIVVDDPERARALVLTLVLGSAGTELITQLAGQATGGAGRTAFWGETITKSIPRSVLGPVTDQLKRTFLKRFGVAQGTNVIGRLIPFGIGAVIGGGGNHLLGRQIVRTSHEGFGPPPAVFPAWLEPEPRVIKSMSPATSVAIASGRKRALPALRMPRRTPRRPDSSAT
jgi:hypothetical protein